MRGMTHVARRLAAGAAFLGLMLIGWRVPARAGGQITSTDSRQSAFAALAAYFDQGVAENRIVGAAISFVKAGAVICSLDRGMADLERQHPVDHDTIFHWASITKTFTAIGIMQLRDRGRLKLDDPVVKYLPELRAVHDPFGDTSEITVRHLMTHSAGFRAATWPWGGDKPWHPFEPTEWSQIVAMLPYTEIEFAPGSRHSYSNPGIIFLGKVIERLTGDDYEVYIDKNVLKPLEMYRTYFDATPYHLLPHRSASYVVVNGTPKAGPFDANTGITVSNGGLNAPLSDMERYLAFLLGGGERRAVYDGVLARRSLEEMFVAQLPVAPTQAEGTAPPTPGDRVSIGLNFFVEDRDGYHLIGHSGDQNGFIAHIYICPALSVGYAVAFNTQTPPTASGEREKTRAFDESLRAFVLRSVLPSLAKPRG
jgi:CubicO group peptidase (beta-lactamase class C family)